MPKLLDTRNARTVAELVLNAAEDEGYPLEEVIPGLVEAIWQAAGLLPERTRTQALDEASDLLADGVEEE